MKAKDEPTKPPANDHDIVTTRVFPTSRERVFEAFRNPQHLRHWWGPEGFTNIFHQFDFRPGGTWLFTMHGPEGAAYDIAKEFIEIVEPARIVLQHLGPVSHRFRLTMTYEDNSGNTELTWRMRFESAAEHEKLHRFIAGANEQNFDRLAAYLKKGSVPL